MQKLHVTSLPPSLTSHNLRVIFERIGPVRRAKIVKDRDGHCIMGVVEMSFAEDVEEILTTKDRISIGGRRPNIWKARVSEPWNCAREKCAGARIDFSPEA